MTKLEQKRDDTEREKNLSLMAMGKLLPPYMHGSYVSCIRIHVNAPKANPQSPKISKGRYYPVVATCLTPVQEKNNRALLLHADPSERGTLPTYPAS